MENLETAVKLHAEVRGLERALAFKRALRDQRIIAAHADGFTAYGIAKALDSVEPFTTQGVDHIIKRQAKEQDK